MGNRHIQLDDETSDIAKGIEAASFEVQQFTGASNAQIAIALALLALQFAASDSDTRGNVRD